MKTSFSNMHNLGSDPILITGHTGFKGVWLTELLHRIGFSVIGVALPPAVDSLYNRISSYRIQHEYFVDIRDKSSVNEIFIKHQPKLVIHLAAQALVLNSYENTLDTFETNVIGTANILEAAIKCKSVRTVGVVTTDKVYRNSNSGRAFVETDALYGNDPYSASKVATEAVIAAYRSVVDELHNQMNIVALRAGNVIGGGDWAQDRLLPDLIKCFVESRQELILRNPKSNRPWQHVLDPLWGYLQALDYSIEHNQNFDFNFGPRGESLSVEEVSNLAALHWGYKGKIQSANSHGPYESSQLALNSNCALEKLQWLPSWSQRESIILTIEWWKKHFEENISAQDLMNHDINKFLERKF